ncbi:MAG: hypothetical protein ACJ74Z_07015 [Bryobacteraceae bacterium]
MLKREVVSLAEVMPPDKYEFAPSNGDFKGVRTFGQQFSQVATVLTKSRQGFWERRVP